MQLANAFMMKGIYDKRWGENKRTKKKKNAESEGPGLEPYQGLSQHTPQHTHHNTHTTTPLGFH